MKRLPVVVFSLAMLVLLVISCSPTPPGVEPTAALVQPTPVVTVNNSNPNAEEIQTIQLDNCEGKGDSKRTEVRSQSIEAEISAGLAAQIGANAGVVQGAVQVAVGTAITSGSERSSSIELAAPPGTHMEIQLVWTGEEQVGVVQNILGSDVPIAFRSFSPTDVRIKSQYDIGCLTLTPTSSGVEEATTSSNEVGSETTTSEEPPVVPPPIIDCSQLIIGEAHHPSLGTNWDFVASNEDRTIHLWSNHWDPNLPEYKFFLPAGQTISFMSGGGSYWSDRPGCSGVARELHKRDGFREITIEQYQMYIEQGAIP